MRLRVGCIRLSSVFQIPLPRDSTAQQPSSQIAVEVRGERIFLDPQEVQPMPTGPFSAVATKTRWTMTRSSFLILLSLFVILMHSDTSAFVTTPTSFSRVASQSSSLHMVLGPKQALLLEKTKNPQKFEATIQNLMKTKRLSRQQAEARYGEFLMDPDGFALRAAEEERRVKGYKDWKEQAIAKSDDPEATRKRIDEFQKVNTLKGTAIILVGFGALGFYNAMHPFVPPGSVN